MVSYTMARCALVLLSTAAPPFQFVSERESLNEPAAARSAHRPDPSRPCASSSRPEQALRSELECVLQLAGGAVMSVIRVGHHYPSLACWSERPTDRTNKRGQKQTGSVPQVCHIYVTIVASPNRLLPILDVHEFGLRRSEVNGSSKSRRRAQRRALTTTHERTNQLW